MKKIGFAFLLYEELHNQSILKQFFDKLKNHHDCDVRAIAHTKDNARFDCMFDIEFIDSIDTSWCDPSCIKATEMLFEELFKQGCDIVYLMSDGMIPLDSCTEFIANNNTTTFKLQPRNFEELNNVQIIHRICNWSWTDGTIRELIYPWEFDKQVMFFCITPNDFEQCRVWFNHFRPYHEERQKWSCMDEYFWVNAMNVCGLPYNNMNEYICVNEDDTKTQSETFEEIPSHVEESYMFIRKIYTD